MHIQLQGAENLMQTGLIKKKKRKGRNIGSCTEIRRNNCIGTEVCGEGRCLKRRRRRCPRERASCCWEVSHSRPLLPAEVSCPSPVKSAMTRRAGPSSTGMSTGMGVQLLQKAGYGGADTPGGCYHSGGLRPEDTSAAGPHMSQDVRLVVVSLAIPTGLMQVCGGPAGCRGEAAVETGSWVSAACVG